MRIINKKLPDFLRSFVLIASTGLTLVGWNTTVWGAPPTPTQTACEAGLTFTDNIPLSFGDILDAGGGGTVTVTTTGAATYGGFVSAFGAVAPTAGEITVSQSVKNGCNYNFVIAVPASVTLSSGAATMTVDQINTNPADTATAPTGTPWANSIKKILVGGRLTVANGQQGGTYSGTISLTVSYQ